MTQAENLLDEWHQTCIYPLIIKRGHMTSPFPIEESHPLYPLLRDMEAGKSESTLLGRPVKLIGRSSLEENVGVVFEEALHYHKIPSDSLDLLQAFRFNLRNAVYDPAFVQILKFLLRNKTISIQAFDLNALPGLKDEDLFELALAINKRDELKYFLEKKPMKSEAMRFDLLKSILCRDPFLLKNLIGYFNISSNPFVDELCKLISKEAVLSDEICQNIAAFALSDETLKEVAINCLKNNPSLFISSLPAFKITDQSALFELATTCVECSSSLLAEHLDKFNLNTQDERYEALLKKLYLNDADAFLDHFQDFKIQDPTFIHHALIDIAQKNPLAIIKIIKVNPLLTSFLKNLPKETLLEITLLCAACEEIPPFLGSFGPKQPSLFINMLSQLDLSEQDVLYEIAKTFAKHNPEHFLPVLTTSEKLKALFHITDSDKVTELAVIIAEKMPTVLLSQLHEIACGFEDNTFRVIKQCFESPLFSDIQDKHLRVIKSLKDEHKRYELALMLAQSFPDSFRKHFLEFQLQNPEYIFNAAKLAARRVNMLIDTEKLGIHDLTQLETIAWLSIKARALSALKALSKKSELFSETFRQKLILQGFLDLNESDLDQALDLMQRLKIVKVTQDPSVDSIIPFSCQIMTDPHFARELIWIVCQKNMFASTPIRDLLLYLDLPQQDTLHYLELCCKNNSSSFFKFKDLEVFEKHFGVFTAKEMARLFRFYVTTKSCYSDEKENFRELGESLLSHRKDISSKIFDPPIACAQILRVMKLKTPTDLEKSLDPLLFRALLEPLAQLEVEKCFLEKTLSESSSSKSSGEQGDRLEKIGQIKRQLAEKSAQQSHLESLNKLTRTLQMQQAESLEKELQELIFTCERDIKEAKSAPLQTKEQQKSSKALIDSLNAQKKRAEQDLKTLPEAQSLLKKGSEAIADLSTKLEEIEKEKLALETHLAALSEKKPSQKLTKQEESQQATLAQRLRLCSNVCDTLSYHSEIVHHFEKAQHPQEPYLLGAALSLMTIDEMSAFGTLARKICSYRNEAIRLELFNQFLNIALVDHQASLQAWIDQAFYLSLPSLYLASWIPPASPFFDPIKKGLTSAAMRERLKDRTSGLEQTLLLTLQSLETLPLSSDAKAQLMATAVNSKEGDIKTFEKGLSLIQALCHMKALDALKKSLSSLEPLADLESAFMENLCDDFYVDFTAITNLADKYFATLDKCRRYNAWKIYENGLTKIPSKPLQQAFGHWVHSVLEGTITRERYKIQSEHSKKMASCPEVWQQWQQPLSKMATPADKDSGKSFDLIAHFKQKVADGHLRYHGQSLFPLFERYLSNPSTLEGSLMELTQNPTPVGSVECKLINLAASKDPLTSDNIMLLIRDIRDHYGDIEFLNDLKGLLDRFQKQKTAKAVHVIETDNWEDVLLCGIEVAGSCQRIDGDPYLNRGLIGYLLNGRTRLVAVKDPQSGQILSRCILRLLWDDEQGKPVLFQERHYSREEAHSTLLDEMVQEKADLLDVELYTENDRSDAIPCQVQLMGFADNAPFEYVDGNRLGIVQGAFELKQIKKVQRPT